MFIVSFPGVFDEPTQNSRFADQPKQSPLVGLLEALGIETLTVKSCREARHCLRTHPPVDLIMTHVSLGDGNWCDVIKCVVDDGIDAPIVVSSPTADERLWSEVLWRGAYDLLVGFPKLDEVRMIVEGALRTMKSRRQRAVRMHSASR